MQYIDEYRDGAKARMLAARIADNIRPSRRYHLMEFCGGHTHTLARYGVGTMLPDAVRMIHGPGCPVCVLPIGRIDLAIKLAIDEGIILCTYGDVMRVPASHQLSLQRAKARGADIRMIYSALDCLSIAQANPQAQVVFFAIGFETTTPPTAVVIQQAQALQLKNFSVLCNHVLTPAVMMHMLGAGRPIEVDGFVGPAHVSTVIGSKAFGPVASQFDKPVVIAGFEPLDILQAILMLVEQINQEHSRVENEYTRSVKPEGNPRALELMKEVFVLRDTFEWRGLGSVPNSALEISSKYGEYDAERRFGCTYVQVADNKACECGEILSGRKHPRDCAIFGTVCTPENPVGSCMVSSEGACAAHYLYGRFGNL